MSNNQPAVPKFKKRPTTDYLVVHCSATPPSMDVGAAEIRKWHLAKKWLDIGYHKVIRRDGTVEDGRNINVQGAHVENFNHCSVGICLVGGVSTSAPVHHAQDEQSNREAQLESHPDNNFTDAQYVSLYKLLLSMNSTWPLAKILGHRDFPNVAKACPSFDVRSWCAGFTLPPQPQPQPAQGGPTENTDPTNITPIPDPADPQAGDSPR